MAIKKTLGYSQSSIKEMGDPQQKPKQRYQLNVAPPKGDPIYGQDGEIIGYKQPDEKALAAYKLKKEGRARRKKFVIAKGKKTAKRRKLLLNIKEATA